MAFDNWEGAPWENPEAYRFHSPLTYATSMRTPLLIIHSDEDWRCNVEQAEQLFVTLKWLNREVEFLRFESNNHELTRSGHPRLRVENQSALVDWFQRYIPANRMADDTEYHSSTNGYKTDVERFGERVGTD
jgi:dipeptidyl aminopeptidase/acylaminoacyl peptidase